MIQCGMCEVEITPPLGNSIPGYFHDRISTGIKDSLKAKALVLEVAGSLVALIALDCIDLPRQVVTGIRDRISRFTTIPPSCVMVSATHTHTGPPIYNSTFFNVNGVYMIWLVEKAADAVILAYAQRREAQIGYGFGHEDKIAFNRRFFMNDGTVRTNPGVGNPLIDRSTGPIDPQVIVIRIDDMYGNPIGVLTNYACHTDVVGGTEYSADYPGELALVLQKVLGDNVVSLFLMGASGNINHYDVIGAVASDYEAPAAHYKKMGRILAGEVLKVREKVQSVDDLQLAARQVMFHVEYRKPTQREIEAARQTILATPQDEIAYNFALELLEAAKSDEPSCVEIEIQAMRLGQLAIVGLPAEIFVEFGLEIKRKSPFPLTLVNQLSNGSTSGYVCTREAYEQGGYEPLITSNNKLTIHAGETFVRHALKLLNDLYIYKREG